MIYALVLAILAIPVAAVFGFREGYRHGRERERFDEEYRQAMNQK